MPLPAPSAVSSFATPDKGDSSLRNDVVVISANAAARSAEFTLNDASFIALFQPNDVEINIRHPLGTVVSWRATLRLPQPGSGHALRITRETAFDLIVSALSSAIRPDTMTLRSLGMDLLEVLALECGYDKASLTPTQIKTDGDAVPLPDGFEFPEGFLEMRFRADGTPATVDDIVNGKTLNFRHLEAEPGRRSGHELLDLRQRKASILARFSLSVSDIEKWRQDIETAQASLS